jgi:hypothetical protein
MKRKFQPRYAVHSLLTPERQMTGWQMEDKFVRTLNEGKVSRRGTVTLDSAWCCEEIFAIMIPVCPGRDSNLVPREYESRALSLS